MNLTTKVITSQFAADCNRRRIVTFGAPRQGKKLLVLDIDNLICDNSLLGTNLEHLMDRPYLHEFLQEVYHYYDIGLWTDRIKETTKEKMQKLRMDDRVEFKILFLMEKMMPSNDTPGNESGTVKLLETVFSYLRVFHYNNTIVCGYQEPNFIITPSNGLLFSHYRHEDRSSDNELLLLKKYLVHIARTCKDFLNTNHSYWRQYVFEHHVFSLKEIVNMHYAREAIKIVNQPRKGKKLLLLDIDHTLCDPKLFHTGQEMNAGRPYLHQFLKSVYQHYDIGLWCYYVLSFVEEKAKMLGMHNNSDYKLTFYIHSTYQDHYILHNMDSIALKPVEKIWKNFPQYSIRNTVMCDYRRQCYQSYRGNAIPIPSYNYRNRITDKILLQLAKYLQFLDNTVQNFSKVSHSLWRNTLEASIIYECGVPTLREILNHYFAQRGYKILNPARKNKKLLVLDIDCTILDTKHYSNKKLKHCIARPYIQELLEGAYQDYDIIFWSSTKMTHLEQKLDFLHVKDSSKYKILCYMEYAALKIVQIGTEQKFILTKPLSQIFKYYKQFSERNSLICDDQEFNFHLNPLNGILIKGYTCLNRHNDKVLLQLKMYLKHIASTCSNFLNLNHRLWMDSAESSLEKLDRISTSTLTHALTWYFKKFGIQVLNAPRKDKKLLVINAEYMMCDELLYGAKNYVHVARPYLQHFLKTVYQYYDIVLWGSLKYCDLDKRMKILGIKDNPNYKIMLFINGVSTEIVHLKGIGFIEAKPLKKLWCHLRQYNYKNTILCDCAYVSYIIDITNGLYVAEYLYKNHRTDKELLRLAKYLTHIAENYEDVRTVNHKYWYNSSAALKYEECEASSLIDILTLYFEYQGFTIKGKPRTGKKLLILDVDYIIFDDTYYGSDTEAFAGRPYLHEFLKSVYQEYDIGFWSNTNMKDIEKKLAMLGVLYGTEYSILFYSNKILLYEMEANTTRYIWVKHLAMFYTYCRQYNIKNTVICDNNEYNYEFNRIKDVPINPYFHANRKSDEELLKLGKYLIYIANACDDFTKLNHTNWFNLPEASLDWQL